MPVDCYCWRQWLSSLSRTKLPKSPLTYLLFCVFGIGSWVAINGVWSEISILVLILPECEKLPAVLVVVIQLANIGPLTYVAVKYIFRKRKQHLEIVTVFILVAVGIIACVLLALFWSKTANIFGSPHSVALIVLTFVLALVDCTSSVVFIPFMKHFPAVYMSGLYIGEGLSGVLPSVVALIQGSVNNSIGCTKSYTGYEALGIRFSPSVFFVFLAIMLLLCGLAFLAINVLPMVRKHMITQEPRTVLDTSSAAQQPQGHTMVDKESKTEKVDQQQSDSEMEHSDDDIDESSPFVSPDEQSEDPSVHISERNTSIQSPQTQQPSVRSVLSMVWSNLSILICLALINFLTNGALNSISSFIFLPYGNTVYHVAINLGLLTYPIASLFALVPLKSKTVTALLTAAACLLAVYELIVALLSPNPPLKDTIGGPIIVSEPSLGSSQVSLDKLIHSCVYITLSCASKCSPLPGDCACDNLCSGGLH